MNTGTQVLLFGLIIASGVIFLATRDTSIPQKESKLISQLDAHNMNIINWLEFISPRGDFEVIFPSAPQYLEEGINIPGSDVKRRYEVYAAEESDGTVYLINIITYPKDYVIDNPQKLMNEVVQEMIKTRTSNRLENTTETTFLGYPAMNFKIDNADMNIMGRAFIVNQSVYVLNYVSMDVYTNLEEYQRFLDSFQFLPKV